MKRVAFLDIGLLKIKLNSARIRFLS